MNLDKFIKECKENPVSLSLQKTTSLGNGAYRVVCELASSNPDNTEIKKAVAKLFNNKVSVVEASIDLLKEDLVTFIVKENVRSLAYNPQNLPNGMKQITASICADVNNNSIWEVISDGNSKRLVLKADQNFNKIFEHNNRICTSASLYTGISVVDGDYVSFYDSKSQKIKAGYALNTNNQITVVESCGEETIVEKDAILQSADLTESGKNPILASFKVESSEKDLPNGATIQKYKDEEGYSGKAYAVQYTSKNGTTYIKGFNTSAEANAFYSQLSKEPKLYKKMTDPILASFTQKDEATIKDYMKVLFKDTEFFRNLNDLMNVRVSEGPDGNSFSTIVTSGLKKDVDDLKKEIKDFLITDCIKELKEELFGEREPEVEEVEGNSEGYLDIDEDMNLESYYEEPNDSDEISEITSTEEEEPLEFSIDMNSIEDISEADEDLDTLLDEEDIGITSEAELDEGEFENIPVQEISNKELLEKLKEVIGE